MCFAANFAKFLRTLFFTEHLWTNAFWKTILFFISSVDLVFHLLWKSENVFIKLKNSLEACFFHHFYHHFFLFLQVHCVKSAQTRSFFWSVFSCIQSKYRKIRTRKNSVFEHFSRSSSLFEMRTNHIAFD